MVERIFIRGADGELSPLRARPFERESDLDDLLMAEANLLAAALSTEDRPLRFLFVESQAAIDDEDGGRVGRWAADLLFLDNEGVLTIVENKLSRNPEIRRKVVGQAIEYAAHLAHSWTIDGIRERLENREDDPEAAVADLRQAGDGSNNTSFWQQVRNNLRAGAIRLVFVADALPRELRMTIEFLNRVTDPMEVVGVEVQQLETGTGPEEPRVVVVSPVGNTEQKRPIEKERSRRILLQDFYEASRLLSDNSQVFVSALKLVKDLANSGLFEVETLRTPTGNNKVTFRRKRDGLRLLSVGANLERKKFAVCAPIAQPKWPVELHRSLDAIVGEPVRGLGLLNDWLNRESSHSDRLLTWLKQQAEPKTATGSGVKEI